MFGWLIDRHSISFQITNSRVKKKSNLNFPTFWFHHPWHHPVTHISPITCQPAKGRKIFIWKKLVTFKGSFLVIRCQFEQQDTSGGIDLKSFSAAAQNVWWHLAARNTLENLFKAVKLPQSVFWEALRLHKFSLIFGFYLNLHRI